ncbi:MAG: succinate dehydrogenase, hydrophobic membrane anchor protein [Pseudomonadota bacterium]|nr:succinate dehydrogenase, hydrophobic membrane anchor protein [Pseudomonadota bacterium]
MTTEVPVAAEAVEAQETPLARVRGLGSAREGAHHWWIERLTSLATLLLFVWLLVSLLRLPSYDHQMIVEWLASPLAAVPMLLLVVATFWHIKLGLEVIVEDYVHDPANRLFLIVLINFAVVVAAAFGLFSVLKVALGSGAA